MAAKLVVASLVGITLVVAGFRIFQGNADRTPQVSDAVAGKAVSANIIPLPNGATIVAAPHSVGHQMIAYLASQTQEPQSFEPGGREYRPWSGDPAPEAQARLTAFTQILKAYPDIYVEIVGHTDNVGDRARNEKLSRYRAVAVVKTLIANGISARRLTASGRGMDQPIADNSTEAGRARNRRITIILSRTPPAEEEVAQGAAS